MQDLTFSQSLAPGHVTSNTTHAGVDITTAQGSVIAIISAAAGGTGTVIPTLQTSDESNANYTAVDSSAFVAGSLSNITNTASFQTVCVDKRHLKNYVRLIAVISGSTNIACSSSIGQRKQVA